MDQIRAILGWLKEHHFWVLALLVLGLSIGGWFTATGSLTQQFSSGKSKIESEFSTQSKLAGKPFKPNPEINRAQAKQNELLATSVKKIWDDLYNVQKAKVLQWPEQLGDAFLRRIERKNFGDTIVRDDRDRYLNYIKRRFPQLLEIIDAEPLEEGGGFGGRGAIGRGRGGGNEFGPGPGGLEDEGPQHMVSWLDQDVLRSKMEFASTPSSLQIWVTQEDLWVYETLLTAIAQTNEASGATRRSNAAVRVIEELQVGAAAAAQTQSTGQIYVPAEGGVGGGGFGRGGFGGGDEFGSPGGGRGFEGGFGPPGGGRGGFDFEGGGFGGAAQADDSTLLEGRYIGPNGEPIPVTPGSYSFGKEYKQLPVRMVLEMDTRWLTELIVRLANAPLQVEVNRLRINPESGDFGRNFGGDEVQAFDRTPTINRVELQGSVYIFNEPDEATFEVGGEQI